MAQVQPLPAVSASNYSGLCPNEAKAVIDYLTRSVGKYFEQVCLEYLKNPVVLTYFQSKVTGIFGGIKIDRLSKDEEKKYLDELRTKFNPIINTIVTQGPVTVARLQQQNNAILNIFSQSGLFKYYDSANWIEKLRDKVGKIYD
jgi:hypothetical protein